MMYAYSVEYCSLLTKPITHSMLMLSHMMSLEYLEAPEYEYCKGGIQIV
jgi:hypothetical protein